MIDYKPYQKKTKPVRKWLCGKCCDSFDDPFYLAGSQYCEICKVKPAEGKFEWRNNQWRSYAVFNPKNH